MIRSALARAEGYGYKYRPDQLRVPAGNPDGGQWTDEGGGGANLRDRVARNRPREDAKPVSNTPSVESTPAATTNTPQTYRDDFVPGDQQPIDGAEIIPAAGEGGNYGFNLLSEETKGGHALKRHFHPSDASLLNAAEKTRGDLLQNFRRGNISNQEIILGSFKDLDAANKLVNATISDNKGLFALFLLNPDQTHLFITSRFPNATGREAYAKTLFSSFDIRPTYGVAVYLLKDPTSAFGSRVHTAFPIR